MANVLRGHSCNPLIIADVSRFAEGKQIRARSRNTSPTEYYHNLHQPPYLIGPKTNPGAVANEADSNQNLTELPELSETPEPMTPYPYNSNGVPQNPRVPLKHDSYYGHRHILQNLHGNDLPAVQDLRDYMASKNLLLEKSRAPTSAPKVTSENSLVDRIMNRPLVRLGPKPITSESGYYDEPRPYVVSTSTLCEVLQVLFSIVVTTLASVLGSSDTKVNALIYRYFIAAGVMSLVAALLFLSKTVRYERKNAAVFCALACIFTGVALILAISTFATDSDCLTRQICSMRRALATISILSFLLWMGSSIVYITTLYISHMEGLYHPPTYSQSNVSESVPASPRKDDLPQYHRNKHLESYP